MRSYQNIVFLGTIVSSTILSAQSSVEKEHIRPNFIFILTDDQYIGIMGHEGNSIIKTPNLDKLAKAGIRFTNAYVTSAICTPSRASIFTGQYERKHGVSFKSGTSLDLETWSLTYPMLMRSAGYYTGYIGKNHTPIGDGGYESGVMEKSFDYWYGGHGHLGFYPKSSHAVFQQAGKNTQVEILEEGSLDFLSNEHKFDGAIRFIDQRPVDKPFCLSICFNLPHNAGTSTMEQKPSDDNIYKSLYRDIEMPLPPHYIAKADIKTPKIPEEVLHYKDRQTSYDYVDTPEGVKERYLRKLQAMTGIDRMVGEIIEALANQNLDNNTIIIFTSDHGKFMGQFGLGGKGLCYQVCTHIPMIIYDPLSEYKDRGKVVNELVQTIDIAPTMFSLAGMDIPETMQGVDLSPLLRGDIKPVRDYIFTENLWSNHFGNPRVEAVQDKEWKYIRYYRNENLSYREKVKVAEEMGIPMHSLNAVYDSDMIVYRHYIESPLQKEPAVYEELFNLLNDPQETTNLINDPSNEFILKRMKEAWWEMLNYARGEDPPGVLRYTEESRAGSFTK